MGKAKWIIQFAADFKFPVGHPGRNAQRAVENSGSEINKQ